MLLLVLIVLLVVFVLLVKLESKKAPVIYEFEDEKGVYYSIAESTEAEVSSKAA